MQDRSPVHDRDIPGMGCRNRVANIGGVNRQKSVVEDMEIARSYVRTSTGRDIALAQADKVMVSAP